MSKISCETCADLMPLVKDEVASEDSKRLVQEHIQSCGECRRLYGEEVIFEDSDKIILSQLKRSLGKIFIIVIGLGILFGISLAGNQLMFYNILIMPTIGAISYFVLRKRAAYVCLAIFILVYLRWLYDSFGYALNGSFIQAFLPPLWWAIIYLGLTMIGVVIAILLVFGFSKEEKR